MTVHHHVSPVHLPGAGRVLRCLHQRAHGRGRGAVRGPAGPPAALQARQLMGVAAGVAQIAVKRWDERVLPLCNW